MLTTFVSALRKDLKLLCIIVVVALLHGLLLLGLHFSPPDTPPAAPPVMAVQMLQMAPEPQPVKQIAHIDPPKQVEIKQPEKVPEPVVQKADIAIPKIEKPKPVHAVKAKPVVKPVAHHASKPPAISKVPSVKTPVVQAVVTQPIFNAAYLNNPPPEYPSLSKRLRETGTVMLKVQVSPSGLAENVAISHSSGYDRLDQVAINAVKRWRFIPAKQDNQPIAAWVIVPLVFTLDT
ncbi:TonB family protein [Rouxiella sp. Mn2063]|uniref:energy transducer TonB n=1 Tax=Rouxiella sp. Mn2063 TaxID=3395262 RepID=UPI003BE9786B